MKPVTCRLTLVLRDDALAPSNTVFGPQTSIGASDDQGEDGGGHGHAAVAAYLTYIDVRLTQGGGHH